jgi:aldehyde:ferredoxin oxidoreductase
MLGYCGKYLRIDLTERKIEVFDLDESEVRKYLGGVGLGARFIYSETSAATAPLAPENTIAAFTGPFTGTVVPSSSRHHIVARSPLTGFFGESNVGGSWAVHLKKAGYDGILISGRAEHPVYLWINEEGAYIRDAKQIWGMETYEAAAQLKAETAAKATAAVIGPAGERGVPLAGIPHIGHIVRSAARTGLGAVMGSKNLKAVVVFGKQQVPICNPDELHANVKAALPKIKEATEIFRKYGTAGGVDTYEKIGNFPIKNWSGEHWEGAAKISGVAMHDTILSGRRACLRCPIACGRHIKVSEGNYAPLDCEGPEYETIGTLGGECMVDNLEAICKANELCNRYGLDTISTGATIAFAMEAFEKGLLTVGDTDGVELNFGNADAMIQMVHKIGRREGIGLPMGEGSRRMAEKLGGGAQEFAVHVKGLEPSAHDPRRFFSHAVNYATAARGACHNASWSHPYELSLSMPEIGIAEPQDPHGVKGKPEFTANLQNMNTAFDTLIICRFAQVGGAVNVNKVLEWLNAITGWGVEADELMTVGERIFNLKRLFNLRAGAGREDDSLPPRFLKRHRPVHGAAAELPPLKELLADYYMCRGWSEAGVPTAEKLETLELKQE